MDLVGEHASAARFHNWAAINITQRADIVKQAVEKAAHGKVLGTAEILHTRYTQDNHEVEGDWPNFQLDGFGTWLWALSEHQGLSKTVIRQEWLYAAQLLSDYLTALWDRHCYDCWEEFPDFLHPSTLAALYAGLLAGADLIDGPTRESARTAAGDIKEFILREGCVEGVVRKAISLDPQKVPPEGVDASLIGVFHPYQLINPSESLAQNTMAKIEADLHREGGGVYRYLKDRYFGGGEWLLLAGWLGWYFSEMGEHSKAADLMSWIEDQTDDEGNLPEQVSDHLLIPECYQEWIDRWGPIA